MSGIKIQARAEATGVIVKEPEFGRTMSGVPVCRFMIEADIGPATLAVRKPVFVAGVTDGEPDAALADLAERCGRNLNLGDTVTVHGAERHRERRVKGRPVIEAAIVAENVRLRQRAASRSEGA
jgi:single-stranded DNA-binding protein